MADPTSILFEAMDSMATLIAAMTTTGGYNYNWGACNIEDLAVATVFPHAVIKAVGEENLDDPNGAFACAYQNIVSFEIRVFQKAASESMNPLYSVREIFCLALDDLKKLFGTNYTLSDNVDCMIYVGSEFDLLKSANDDMFVPYEMITRWRARYTQSRTSPADHA
jgi:hypothetical protein